MKRFKIVKKLTVNDAKYQLDDGNGNDALLLVDYKNNQFQIKSKTLGKNAEFINEVEKFAKGLLARKHAVNLAKKKQLL